MAKNYYDSADADTFTHSFGGEDIHIGLYQGANDDIAAASQRTIAHMAKQLSEPEAHIYIWGLDLAALALFSFKSRCPRDGTKSEQRRK